MRLSKKLLSSSKAIVYGFHAVLTFFLSAIFAGLSRSHGSPRSCRKKRFACKLPMVTVVLSEIPLRKVCEEFSPNENAKQGFTLCSDCKWVQVVLSCKAAQIWTFVFGYSSNALETSLFGACCCSDNGRT